MSGTYTYAMLQKAVADAQAAAPFTIGAAQLPGSALTRLLAAYLPGGALTLTLAAAPVDTGASITLNGPLQATLLGLADPSAEAVLTVVDGEPQLKLDLTAPTGWTPSQSFPALAETPFDAFSWTDCALVLDSTDARGLPADFPADLGWPTYRTPPVWRTGLSLRGGIALRSDADPALGLAGLAWAFAGKPVAVAGPIGIVDAFPEAPASLLLTGDLGQLSVGGFSGDFSLLLGAALLDPNGQPPSASIALIGLKAAVTCQSVSFDLTGSFWTGSGGLLTFSLVPSTAEPLTIDRLGAVVGGLLGAEIDMSWTGSIPAAKELALTSGVIGVSLPAGASAPTVTSLGFTVGFVLPSPWEVFPGAAVDSFETRFTYFPQSRVGPLISAQGEATVGGATLDLGLTLLPDLAFDLRLSDGGDATGGDAPGAAAAPTADLTSALSSVTGGTMPSWMSGTKAQSVELTGAPAQGTATLNAAFQDVWTAPDAGLKFSVDGISAGLRYDKAAKPSFTGQFGATLTVAGEPLFLAVSYDGTGWNFAGGTEGPVTLPIGELAGHVAQDLGITLPSTGHAYPSLTLLNLNASYATATSEFSLKALCSAEFGLLGHQFGDGGTPVQFGVEVLRTKDPAGAAQIVFHGYLWIGDDVFEIDFTKGGSTVVVGSWSANQAGAPLDLRKILASLGLDLSFLPDSIDLTLNGAAIVYDTTAGALILIADSDVYGELAFVCTKTGTGHNYGVAARAKPSINLSDLPLVGQELAKIATLSVGALQISAVDGVLGSEGKIFNDLLAQHEPYPNGLTYPAFPTPEPSDTTKVLFTGTLDYGSGSLPFQLPLEHGQAPSTPSAPAAPAASGAPPTVAAAAAAGSAPAPAQPGSDGTLWFTLQKSFGPVAIQRVGLRYSDQKLWFELDATLAFGPLSFELLGLGIGSPIATFSPSFSLQGLGVAYNQSPLSISGTLINLVQPGDPGIAFQGSLVIETSAFSAEAVGYYGDLSGYPSLFIFLESTVSIGGSPEFTVTGLAGGFGYNSAVRLPGIADLASFPFLAALPAAPIPDPGATGGAGASPQQALNSLTGATPPWITSQKGQIWVAAGLTFTSFEMVDGVAMLLVEAGDELEIALFGEAHSQFPQKSVGGPTYAQIVLALEARLQPQRGFFSIEAVLTPGSFLFDPACVLTGGFAFYIWYGPSDHAGDFVLCLGGYHSAFTPPPWYPQVPRIGFHWALDGSVTVQGGCYLALTPSVMMAGGALDVTFQSGNLKAWLNAHCDILVRWKPFWLDAQIGITVGASYKIDLLFTSVTVSVELGCELEIYGPPTGGSVSVDWYIISFTIPFGADRDAGLNQPQQWSDIEAVLPKVGTGDAAGILSMQVSAGLVSDRAAPGAQGGGLGAAAAEAPPLIVRAGAFSFTTRSPIPASSAQAGDQPAVAGSPFNVHPLGWSGVEATHQVTFTDHEGDDRTSAFVVAPVIGAVPAALWGSPPENGGGPQVPSGTQATVGGQITGFSFTARPPVVGSSAGPVDSTTELRQANLFLPGAVLPVTGGAAAQGDVATTSADTVDKIADADTGIAAQATADRRGAILAALQKAGLAANSDQDMTDYAQTIGGALAAEPLLVN